MAQEAYFNGDWSKREVFDFLMFEVPGARAQGAGVMAGLIAFAATKSYNKATAAVVAVEAALRPKPDLVLSIDPGGVKKPLGPYVGVEFEATAIFGVGCGIKGSVILGMNIEDLTIGTYLTKSKEVFAPSHDTDFSVNLVSQRTPFLGKTYEASIDDTTVIFDADTGERIGSATAILSASDWLPKEIKYLKYGASKTLMETIDDKKFNLKDLLDGVQ